MLLTTLEHHANIVPWQQVASIDVVDIDHQGHLQLEMLEEKTEGNLSDEESKLLASALKNLRPLYDRICEEHSDDDE